MQCISFNDNWFVRHTEEDGLGTSVTLPHDAMLAEPRSATAEGGLNISWFEGRDYIYTKKFTVSETALARHNVLEFEGVYRKSEVWVNEKKVMFRPYGYTNFYVELDGHLHVGENTVEVVARNADQPNSRWYSGSGIYRPVKLVGRNRLCSLRLSQSPLLRWRQRVRPGRQWRRLSRNGCARVRRGWCSRCSSSRIRPELSGNGVCGRPASRRD